MPRSGTFEVLLDHTQDQIALVDENEEYTYVNAAAEQLLGFTPDELVGTNIFEQIHPDDLAEVRQTFETVTQSDQSTERTVEYQYRTGDDSWIWLESRITNLTDTTFDGYVVSSQDITHRVKDEQNYRAPGRLTEITSASSEVLWMFNGDWSELLFINPAYEQIYGGSIEELQQRPESFLETTHPDDIPAVTDAMECLSAGNSVDIEYRVNSAQEYNVWVWVQAHPIIEDGDVVRIAGFSRDVTNRRRRERQLAVMDNLLRHNLRNELNVILGRAELIEQRFPETREATAVIRETGERLLQSAEKQREIIDLLNDRSPGLDRVNLREIVELSATQLREDDSEATIEVSGADSAHARASTELPHAVLELLENAIQHSTDNPAQVEVTVRETSTHGEIIVEDELEPIPEIEANVLRGDHDMDAIYHSSGLGFWLVYWTVELSDGDIVVNSADGRGNRITLSLPRAEP